MTAYERSELAEKVKQHLGLVVEIGGETKGYLIEDDEETAKVIVDEMVDEIQARLKDDPDYLTDK